MKIFIDSANYTDVEEALKRGFAQGITTNPSLLAKEPKSSFVSHIKGIIDLVKKHQPGIHLSVEVFSKDPAEILAQAQDFIKQFDYPSLGVKIQVGWDELEVIKKLAAAGIAVNCTACMSVTQAVMAARAGAKYVSLFWGRIRDGGIDPASAEICADLKAKKILEDKDFDPFYVVQSVRQIFDQDHIDSEIIVGSIRSVLDIKQARLAGAHIVTIPPKFFKDMITHFKTTQAVDQFMNDFKQWLS